MSIPSQSDPDLLSEWLTHQRELAFHALVSRYAGLVHATARRSCGDESMAAEVSQLTFITLARKARSLTSCASLGGWLHHTAMLHAKNLHRQSQRENRKLRLLAMENHSHSDDDAWREVRPVIDEALAALAAKDREALLLRFYRALSVQDVAVTLGIGTDAAQKRIERAVVRLRTKLTRRGVQTGGSLGTAILTGFAADAQASTLSAPILASKAIAAAALGSGAFSTLSALMTASKLSLIPATIILVGLVGWVGTQRKLIAALEKEVAVLQSGVMKAESGAGLTHPAAKPFWTVKVFHGDQPIDWREVAAVYKDPRSDPQWMTKLREKLQLMSAEDLIVEMDKIAALFPSHPFLEQLVLRPLIEKDPELPLRHLIGRLEGGESSLTMPLCDALREWAKLDVAAAMAWFDEQAAAGAFKEKQLDSRYLLDQFHGQIIGVLISQDWDAAAARFQMIPQTERSRFLERNMIVWAKEVTDYPAFASLVRESLVEKDRLWPIAGFARAIAFEKVGEFLDSIHASPEEREESAEKAAKMRIWNLGRNNHPITRAEFDTIREWAVKLAPHAVGKVTGAALAESADNGVALSFDQAAIIALEYHVEMADDSVLIGFLDSLAGRQNKAAARVLANRIIDPEIRSEFLRNSHSR